jgi:hypothetical protein
MREKIGAVLCCASLGWLGSAHAVSYTDWANGALLHTAGSVLGTGDEVQTDGARCGGPNSGNPQSYCNDTFTVFWDIDKGDDNTWRYTYSMSGTIPGLSHWIIQVSDSFTTANLLTGSTSPQALNTYSSADPSNPGLPSTIFGLKWDVPDGANTITSVILTDRMPVWGNIYLKGGSDAYAYNVNWFGSANGTSVAQNSDLFGYIGRPDSLTQPPDPPDPPVPSPAVLWLMLLGAVGLLGLRKHR